MKNYKTSQEAFDDADKMEKAYRAHVNAIRAYARGMSAEEDVLDAQAIDASYVVIEPLEDGTDAPDARRS